MNSHKLEKTIRKELEALNNRIDEKIIKGLPYAKDAKRHKLLLSSLYNLRREQPHSNWFGETFDLSRAFII